MNKPNKHHYVPKCYLNKFCNEQGDIYRLNIDDYLSIKRVNPTAICYESSFYSIDDEIKSKFATLNDRDEMEVESDILAKIESNYNRLYEQIISGKSLPWKEATSFSEFIVLLKTRTKFWREKIIRKTIEDNVDRIAQDLLADSHKHERFRRFPEDLRRLGVTNSTNVYKTDPVALKYLQMHRLMSMGEPNFQKEIIQAMMNSRWTLVINETSLPFVTTDNPGVSFNTKTAAVHSVGFNGEFVFMLPLSPKHLLRIDCTKKDISNNSSKAITIDHPNINVIEMINRQLIHITDSIIIASDRECLDRYKGIIAHHRLVHG